MVPCLMDLMATLAQDEVGPAPQRSYAWLAVVIALVLTAAVIAISFMSSKRTHRD